MKMAEIILCNEVIQSVWNWFKIIIKLINPIGVFRISEQLLMLNPEPLSNPS